MTMTNFFFATESGTIYHVGEGTITRVAKDDQSNVPHDIHAEPFEWNVEPAIGFRAGYLLTSSDGYITTSIVTHIWPAPKGYNMLPTPEPEPITAEVLAATLIDTFA